MPAWRRNMLASSARPLAAARSGAQRMLSTVATRAAPLAALRMTGAARATIFAMPATHAMNLASSGARSMSEGGGGGGGRMGNDEDRKCFVGNLNWKTSSDDLHDFFKQWGQIQDARVIMDRDNPFRSRGFGFIVFDRASDASDAVAACNDKEWNGRSLRVNLANRPPVRSAPDGDYN
mmetsp:Transcript_6365/g.14094  ORF Transcript_6365/g.14094 Transcript_6365/m.14094 type:complete len:178 (+) Transcript_6365:2-535(+)